MLGINAFILLSSTISFTQGQPLTESQISRQVLNDGTYMPYEGLPHLRTMMAWPDRLSVYTDEQFEGAKVEIAAIANTISRFESVWLYVDEKNLPEAKSHVSSPNVTIQSMPVSQLWIRDYGPTFVKNTNGSLSGIEFNFNYWGKKLDPIPGIVLPQPERKFTKRMLAAAGVPRIRSSIVTEGGAIEVDGDGTLMSSDAALVNDNRNPNKTQAEIENILKSQLGASKMIWLKGLKGKDLTDWHIDAQARFAGEGKILMSRPSPSEPADGVDWQLYNHNIRLLRNTTDARGRPIEIIDIEEADVAKTPGGGKRADSVVSYVNYYLANGAIIIPKFGDSTTDDAAAQTFKKVFPDREVAQVPINALPRIGGGIHCSTQQWPSVGY